MMLFSFAVLSTLLLAAQAQVSWYVPSRNITCNGGGSGQITCHEGHIDDAPEVQLSHPEEKRDSTPAAVRGRTPEPLEKRVTCNIDGVTQGLACFTHCFGIGYCNSHCDGNNICHCTCKDETPWLLSAALVVVLLCSQPLAAADDKHGVTFLFPTEGQTFYYLDTINVTYLRDFPHPHLYTFCDGGNRFIRTTPSAPYNGSTLVLLSFTSSTPCYFNPRPGTVAGQGANGTPFVLVDGQHSQTIIGLTEPFTTSTATNTSSASPSSSSSSGGLSGGAAAGIGVGVALGVIALAGGIGFWVWRRRKARKAAAGGSYAGVDMSGPHFGTGSRGAGSAGGEAPRLS
ncbi:hypothetical protein QBC33DRAFT_603324 [Phialemonium atrogriseum]|uniref:Mid2 domain-containing protein n=1 Tax=Phialemonium atrogriseum TaxID=1093897 RepID=A0AAJ0C580_9PEZI|nr:uncharacterized protein QBC33DRAFT_603324 [Phialemonium atrogriseum]KAK1770176.1 hypothetical protein QBC33DRAFT_603324 [Phialemonium atrogriseum]